MTSIIIRILLLALILWMIQRFLSRVLGGAAQPRAGTTVPEAPNNMVKDPVCGMYMDSRLAVRLEGRKEQYFFCSEECKKRYLGGDVRGAGAGSAPPG